MSEQESEYSDCDSEGSEEIEDIKNEDVLGCKHYQRDCKVQSPCCNKMYPCRFCHDEAEDHSLVRQNISIVECLHCQKVQPVSNKCTNEICKATFGKYYCDICKLFDNVDKKQYHCEGCGLCRAGGQENFFHCERCQMCLPTSIKETHKCIVELSQRDCTVCLEDIHTSRIVAHVPSCGHLIHQTCFQKLLKNGIYACPTCAVCLIEMKEAWKELEEEIRMTPMPGEYSNCYCYVHCKDCQKETLTEFHVLGQKCANCGSFNTARGRGSILTQSQVDVIRNDEREAES